MIQNRFMNPKIDFYLFKQCMLNKKNIHHVDSNIQHAFESNTINILRGGLVLDHFQQFHVIQVNVTAQKTGFTNTNQIEIESNRMNKITIN